MNAVAIPLTFVCSPKLPRRRKARPLYDFSAIASLKSQATQCVSPMAARQRTAVPSPCSKAGGAAGPDIAQAPSQGSTRPLPEGNWSKVGDSLSIFSSFSRIPKLVAENQIRPLRAKRKNCLGIPDWPTADPRNPVAHPLFNTPQPNALSAPRCMPTATIAELVNILRQAHPGRQQCKIARWLWQRDCLIGSRRSTTPLWVH